MIHAILSAPNDFGGWRDLARQYLGEGVAPEHIRWSVAGESPDLFADAPEPQNGGSRPGPEFRMPRRFVALAAEAILHSEPGRFGLLYRLASRLLRNRALLDDAADPDVARAEALAQAVRRDSHKMTAFVRFRAMGEGEARRLVAWFEPEHHIVERTAPFFVGRFANVAWSILTPQRSAHWDRNALFFGPGATRAAAPGRDPLEDVWRAYYAGIFNPARLRPAAMRAEMPKKYWRNLPEASLIPSLIAGAGRRVEAMIAEEARNARRLPQRALDDEGRPDDVPLGDLSETRAAAQACRACPLWASATQTVFGEGPGRAGLMLVGEQPGDVEDLKGRPFVGPAGKLLDRALDEAGIDRADVYVTNAVKHFKFVVRGKRRIHEKPSRAEIVACKPWLEREIELVRPDLIVALGATAVQALLGRALTIGANRGRAHPTPFGPPAFITVHPSFLLRLPDEAIRQAEFARFVADLAAACASLPARDGGVTRDAGRIRNRATGLRARRQKLYAGNAAPIV